MFLAVLTSFRLLLFYAFSPSFTSDFYKDIIAAFWLGFRIDLALISYIMIVPLLIIIINHIINNRIHTNIIRWIVIIYFFTIYFVASLLIGMDFSFYSYFNEHITIMIFGIIDDDTAALLSIAQKNYNLFLILALGFVYTVLLFMTVKIIILHSKTLLWLPKWQVQTAVYLSLVLLVFLGARGTVGMFPLIKNIPDVSSDPFINSLPLNGVFAVQKASKLYARNKSGKYDLLKQMGYSNNKLQAFKSYLGRDDISRDDLFVNLEKTTPVNEILEKKRPHVVVVMVESFGTPILKYQSDTFDIMRSLKKHFTQDILFTNFISTSNGTIVSMEPLLLNLIARPGSISFGQSEYLGVSFSQAAAKVYQKAGYETHFVYGGDLSWRNVGSFFARQGFEHVDGKGSIKKVFPQSTEHDWGVYDKYAYKYVLKQLNEAKKPQFIFLLTTNNHPPYELDTAYDSKSLVLSKKLKTHITGDMVLVKKRLQDYQYALDMAGKFMDKIKNSLLAEQTVVAITADNNTIEGIMHYDNYLQESKKIPFYLYLPPYLRRETPNVTTPGSHKDIFPTLYNLTLSNVKYRALGTDLFDSHVLHCGFNDRGIIISKEGAFQLSSSPILNACEKQYKAALAVGEIWIKSQK